MLDLLVALAQFACLIGLAYGAFLCLTHHDCVYDLRAQYDPISGPEWLSFKHEPDLRIAIVPMAQHETRAANREMPV